MNRIVIGSLMFLAWVLLAQNELVRSKPGEFKNGAGIEFVQIQTGEFMMGCSDGDNDCKPDEKPAHHVEISKGFQIGKYEVTQAQWQMVMGSNPSTIKGEDHPVETISKDEAHEFLNRLNAMNDGYHYRLPSEAEWEYAARAGSTSPYFAPLDEIAWYGANSEDETHPVGKKKPNAWGLYDMEGNVKEWVEDFYSANYYSNSPAADPTGPQGGTRGGFRGFRGRRGRFDPPSSSAPANSSSLAGLPAGVQGQRRGGPREPRGGGRGGLPVMRGGAWDNPASYVRVSARYSYYGATLRVSDVGFRVVRQPEVQR